MRILQGDEDDGMSVENARALAEHLPEAEVVVLSEVDHSFQTDQSRTVEETLATITD